MGKQYLPSMTFKFLEYFNKFNFKDKICLEIGSGDSTIYWSYYFKKIISYEHDLEWAKKIKKEYKTIQRYNIELIHYDKDIFTDKNFKKNISEADCIIIDNKPLVIKRDEFCFFVKQYRKKDSIIVLDNGTWNLHAYDYMQRNFFCKDFPGIDLDSQNKTVTTLFFEEKTNDYYLTWKEQ